MSARNPFMVGSAILSAVLERMKLPRISRRTSSGLILGFLAKGLQYGMALFVLPLVLIKLPPAEVGIWYVFMTVQGLVALFDFGFQPTFSRYFTMALSGVSRFERVGLGSAPQGEANIELAAELFTSARRLYGGLSLAILAILLTAGSFYVYFLADRAHLDVTAVETAWLLFAAGASFNFYFQWINPLLIGSGAVSTDYVFQIMDRVLFGVSAAVLLLANGGLLSLAVASLVTAVGSRLLIQPYVRPYVPRPVAAQPENAYSTGEILGIVWHNASRMGLVALGAFLIMRSNFLVLSTFASLAESARYAVTFQLLFALYAVSQLPVQVVLPRMVAARVRGDKAALRRAYLATTGFFAATFTCGSIVLVMVGAPLLRLIGSHVQLLPTDELFLLALVLLLEGNHSIAGTMITTQNRVPFVVPALVSGFAIVVLSTVAGWYGLGVLGIIAVQGLVQLSYNNWRWPLEVVRDLWG